MLQIIIRPNDRYSLGECAQMAVEAGAKWLQLAVSDGDIDALREEIDEIVTLCRDGGVILTVEDRPDLARDFGLHGVFLHAGSQSPVAVRENLGAEAIIGAEAGSAGTAMSLYKADIDYVTVNLADSSAASVLADIRKAGCEVPVVACIPDAMLDDDAVAKAVAAGFSGACVGTAIFTGGDPVARIEGILKTIS